MRTSTGFLDLHMKGHGCEATLSLGFALKFSNERGREGRSADGWIVVSVLNLCDGFMWALCTFLIL